MNKQPLISVIVPVYNVESYLNQCVDSILSQTYDNLEVILVDDGSPDNCGIICDDYARKDDRIKVIHKENGGLSSARNAGMKFVSGDFVGFVDSDDWLAKDTYEYCLSKLDDNGCDAILFNSILTSDRSKTLEPIDDFATVIKGRNEILDFFMYNSTKSSRWYSVWGGLYKRELVEGITFREGKLYEDIDWKYKVIERAQNLLVTNQIKYFYFFSGSSITARPLRKRDFDLYDSNNAICELSSKETYGSIRKMGLIKKAKTPFSLLCKIVLYGIDKDELNEKDVVKRLVSEHRRNLKMLMCSPIGFKRKIFAVLLAVNYGMIKTFMGIIKKGKIQFV